MISVGHIYLTYFNRRKGHFSQNKIVCFRFTNAKRTMLGNNFIRLAYKKVYLEFSTTQHVNKYSHNWLLIEIGFMLFSLLINNGDDFLSSTTERWVNLYVQFSKESAKCYC